MHCALIMDKCQSNNLLKKNLFRYYDLVGINNQFGNHQMRNVFKYKVLGSVNISLLRTKTLNNIDII